MIEVKETDDGKWGLYLDGVLLGDSKHRYEADHAKQADGTLVHHNHGDCVRPRSTEE